MPITIYQGLPGAGKSQLTAIKILDLLNRNKKWFKKTGIIRKIYINLNLNEEFENENKEYIFHFKDVDELPTLKDCDVVIDEMIQYFDAHQWEHLSVFVKRWLTQHRKLGIEIYGNTQDFAQIDKSLRRLTSKLIHLRKVIGSRDPSATSPPIKHLWGLILHFEANPQTYKEDEKENTLSFAWDWTIIRKKYVALYDTRFIINPDNKVEMKHIIKYCNTCGKEHVVHS